MKTAHKLRILCLHGYHGNADVMRSQMRGLVSEFDALADFVCVDAPSLSAGDYGWWHAVPKDRAPTRGDPGVFGHELHYEGWQRTRDWIVSVFRQQGPFDGVLGFSQGAALTGLLVGLRAPGGRPTAERPLAFDFAVMVGGFPSADPSHAPLYDAPGSFALPSVHVIGRSDGIVPPRRSHDLASRFRDPIVLEHDGGHVIAATPEIRRRFASFLLERTRHRAGLDAAAAPFAEPGAAAPSPRSPIQVPLWPGRDHPAMQVFLPAGAPARPRPALLVFRGGAYATCKGSGGGSAEWAAEHGMVGVEVEYATRAAGGPYPASYADAARAVRLVRHRAAEWGVDPRRVGALGYSAGGHLVSLVSTQPDLFAHPDDDLSGRVSARPDLVVLGYPVISFVDGYSPGALGGSTENFFGRNADEATRRRFSSELHVTSSLPPVFLWTTEDDALVPAAHSKIFADACRRAGVPVAFELHPHGRHGMGLALDEPTEVRGWTSRLLAWLSAQWGSP